ncbi:hypothetical protein HDV63DRAFT_107708 [Trichoderma sp. SZMC 28014]
MQLHLLLTVFVGAAYAAATLTPADCDCLTVCNSNLTGADNCYNSNIGCGTAEEPTCCEICGCNCP